MSKSNAAETDWLKLLFNNTTWAGVGDAGGIVGSTAAGSLFVSLHTADPGEGGDQTTSEIAYTGYARVAVARSTGGWTVTNNSVSPVATISFGQMTAGAGGTVTHFGVGKSTSGAGELLYSGTVTPNIAVTNGVTPQLTTATAITED
jgi:hypothetical protein